MKHRPRNIVKLISFCGFLWPLSAIAQTEFREVITLYNDDVQLSVDAYNNKSVGKVADTSGWQRTRDWEQIINDSDRSVSEKKRIIDAGRASSFYAAEYKNDGQVKIAFRGTETNLSGFIRDGYTDMKQAVGLTTDQYDLVGKELSKDIAKMDKVSCTGHSLGAGVGNYVCGLANKPSVGINSAGLNETHMKEVGKNSKAVNIFVGDDQVHKMGFTNQPGKKIALLTKEVNGAIYSGSDFNLKDLGRSGVSALKAADKHSNIITSPVAPVVAAGTFIKGVVKTSLIDTHSIAEPAKIFSTWNKVLEGEKKITSAIEVKTEANVLPTPPKRFTPLRTEADLNRTYDRISAAIDKPSFSSPTDKSKNQKQPVESKSILGKVADSQKVKVASLPSTLGNNNTLTQPRLTEAQIKSAYRSQPYSNAPIGNYQTNPLDRNNRSQPSVNQSASLNTNSPVKALPFPVQRPYAPKPQIVLREANAVNIAETQKRVQFGAGVNKVNPNGHSLGGNLNQNANPLVNQIQRPSSYYQRGQPSQAPKQVYRQPSVRSQAPSYDYRAQQQAQRDFQDRYIREQAQTRAYDEQQSQRVREGIFNLLSGIAEGAIQQKAPSFNSGFQQRQPGMRVRPGCEQVTNNQLANSQGHRTMCLY